MFVVETYQGKAVPERSVEIVERKGIGDPDTICDAIMEAISVALSKTYLPARDLGRGRRFGAGRPGQPRQRTDRHEPPLGTEAAAGKNPVSHVWKIYSVLAHRLARQVYERIEGLKEVYVLLLSRIGTPVDSPVMATAQVLLENGQSLTDIRQQVEEVLAAGFADLDGFCRRLGNGEFPVC